MTEHKNGLLKIGSQAAGLCVLFFMSFSVNAQQGGAGQPTVMVQPPPSAQVVSSSIPAMAMPSGVPTIPATPALPEATPVPLCDISGPWEVFRWPVAVILGVAAVLVVLGLLIAWRSGAFRAVRPLLPQEIALRELEALRNFEGTAYELAIRVSDTLRKYIRAQFGLDAVNRTSLEFLDSLRSAQEFTGEEKAALAEFLESADLIKFARVEASDTDTAKLFDTAMCLVSAKREEAQKTEIEEEKNL